MDLITALTLGLIGSFHCIGMCGPIAIALPLPKENWWYKISGVFLYNIGRVITYGILGALFGLLGKGIQLAGFQRIVSILMGAIMVISVVFPFVFRNRISIDSLFGGYVSKFVMGFKKLFKMRSLSSLLIIGLLNGLLPCGLVYIAVAGAINTNDVTMGILYMVAFGLGTAPMLAVVTLAGNMISGQFRSKVNKIIPYVVVIVGILFILRGLSLGIPYVSPKEKMLEPHEKMEMKKEKESAVNFSNTDGNYFNFIKFAQTNIKY